MKTRLHTQAEFQARIGKVLFESAPRTLTKSQIQDYCRSLNQLDWFHFDEARSKAEGYGGIIAPGSLTFALVHTTFFEHVELVDLKALFVGSNRFRVLRPVSADEAISLFSEASFFTIVSDPRPVSCAERASRRGFRKGMGSWGGSLVVSHHRPANNEAYTTSYTVCSLGASYQGHPSC